MPRPDDDSVEVHFGDERDGSRKDPDDRDDIDESEADERFAGTLEGDSQESLRRKTARTVIAVGGGRGGVGKSLIASNLAVYFAQLGKTVVLVDADPTAANLHTQCGTRAAASAPLLDEPNSFARALVQTSVPGLSLLPSAHDSTKDAQVLRGSRKNRWLARLRALPADYLVIDVGPGHGHFAVDILLAVDIPITVTAPEPPAIEATYRFLRASYLRKLRRAIAHDRLHINFLERGLAEIGRLPSPLELVRVLTKTDPKLAEFAWAEAQRLKQYLVVNQTRVRADLELGAWMRELTHNHYGIRLEELGHIEHDDTVWLAVRRKRPLLVDSPASKGARNLERVARRVVALSMAKERHEQARQVPSMAPDLYAVLNVSRSASDEDVRRAYKKQREVYSPSSVAIASLFSDEALRAQETRLDEAYDTLLDPIRRRAYDLSTFPDDDSPGLAVRTERPPLAAEQLLLQSELLREIGPETEFTGALLRKVRESKGIEISEIAAKTKISRLYLDAIEAEEPKGLPALVYVRGFVAELAKFLRLDPVQVQRTYLRRLEEGAGQGA